MGEPARGGPLRVGLIGCGVAAQSMHLPILGGLRGHFRLVAVCDLDVDRAGAVAADAGVEAHGDAGELLARDDLDAVLVLASGNHHPLVRAALERGLHVLVEKPLCFRASEADDLVSEAERRRLTLMVGYTRWFDPAYQRLQQLLASSLAPPLLARVLTVQTPESIYLQHHRMIRHGCETLVAVRADERADQMADELADLPVEARAFYLDMLLDNSIHDLYLLRGLLGPPVRLASAALDPSRTAFHVSWRFAGDVRGEYDFVLTGGAGGRYEQRLELVGDGYRIVLSYPSPYLRHSTASLSVERSEGASEGAKQETWWPVPGDAVENELLHFEECVRRGTPAIASGRQGATDITLLQQVTRRLWSGQAT